MSQNLIDIDLNTDALAAIDNALTALETGLASLIALTPDQRHGLTKMGDKSEAFCRQAGHVFGDNPGLLPGNFDLAGYQRDLATLDALRPRRYRNGDRQRPDDQRAGGLRGVQGRRQGAGAGRCAQGAVCPFCPWSAHVAAAKRSRAHRPVTA
jgi:hypothetical protein